jgi:O-antigen/teichoic acid export membrane protein
MTARRELVRTSGGYFVTMGLQQVVSLGRLLIAARVLGPTAYGVVGALALISSYAAHSHLGTLNAMNRDVPISRGRGDEQLAERIRRTTLGSLLLPAVAVAAALFALSFRYAVGHGPYLAPGLRVIAATIVLQQLVLYFQFRFRSDNRFDLANGLNLAQVALAIVTLPLILHYGFIGFLWSQVLIYLGVAGYGWARAGGPVRAAIEWPLWRRLVGVGWPILVSSVCYGLLQSIDQLTVLKLLGATALGYYAIGVKAAAPLGLLARVSEHVMYPRFGERYGETGAVASLRRYVEAPSLTMALVFPAVLGVICTMLPGLIRVALPAYEPGIRAAQIVVMGLVCYGLMSMALVFLTTIGRQIVYTVVFFAAMPVMAAACLGSVSLGWGLTGVAAAAATTYCLAATVIIAIAMRYHRLSWREHVRYFAGLYGPCAYVIAAVWAVEWLLPATGAPRAIGLITVARVVVVGLAAAPLLAMANRRTGALSEFARALRARLRPAPAGREWGAPQ